MLRVKGFLNVKTGSIQGELGQCRHGTRHDDNRRLLFAVQAEQALKHELPRDAQCGGDIRCALPQRAK